MLILSNNILETLIGLIFPNNIITNDVLSNEVSLTQHSFLQKKRCLENNNIIQNYENIHFQNTNNKGQIKYYHECYRENQLFSPKFINPLYNDINQCKFGDSSNYCNFIVNNDIIKQNFINNNIGNLNYHLNGGLFNMYSAQKYSFRNLVEDINKINIINSKNIKDSLNEKINKKDSLDCYKSEKALSNKTKNKIFKVTKLKEKKSIKKFINKKMIQNKNNKKIKVLKNKKLVYVNSFLLNSDSASKNIKRLNKVIFIGINRRGSKFRGVSRNGNQYQVLIMINKKKIYIGSYPVEEDAARIYDILTLKFRGIKAKTNYYYNYEQIKKIQALDIKNIFQIISKLNK